MADRPRTARSGTAALAMRAGWGTAMNRTGCGRRGWDRRFLGACPSLVSHGVDGRGWSMGVRQKRLRPARPRRQDRQAPVCAGGPGALWGASIVMAACGMPVLYDARGSGEAGGGGVQVGGGEELRGGSAAADGSGAVMPAEPAQATLLGSATI